MIYNEPMFLYLGSLILLLMGLKSKLIANSIFAYIKKYILLLLC